ncbi:hypothetical protein ACLOJK_014556 [Asimina triloba]
MKKEVLSLLKSLPKRSSPTFQTCLSSSKPIPDKFEVPRMPIFGPTSDLTGHVVNYNIYMDLRTTSEGLNYKAFLATLGEQRKMWFASLVSNSIVSFKQLTALFEA